MRRLLVVSAVVMLAQIAIVAKQAQGYYLAPVLAFVCLANGAISYLLVRGGIGRRMLGAAIVLALVTHGLWHGARPAVGAIKAEGAGRHEDVTLQQRLATTACKVVYAYESQTIPYKLFFGDIFAGHRYLALVHTHYPDVVFYLEGGQYFDTATGILNAAEADAWVGRQNCVYLVSSPMERFTPQSFGISPQYLTLIDRSPHGRTAIYKIEAPAAGESIFVKRP